MLLGLNIPGAVALIATVIVIATASGAALAFFRVSLKKGIEETLRAENADLRDRVETLENERTRDKTEIEHLTARVGVLTDIATGTTAIKELDAKISQRVIPPLLHIEEVVTAR